MSKENFMLSSSEHEKRFMTSVHRFYSNLQYKFWRIVSYPFMQNGMYSSAFTSDRTISNMKGVWLVFIITMFYRNSDI